MNKTEEVVIRYENARQQVSTLKHKVKSLIDNCDGYDTIDDNHGQLVSVGNNCFVEAYSCVEGTNSVANSFDEYATYEDTFFCTIWDDEGACDSCKEAYWIKHTELKVASGEFGNAKRALSYLGKRLIKEGVL
jgi:hypothetical protein